MATQSTTMSGPYFKNACVRATELSVEEELREDPDIFENELKELKELRKSTTLSWKTQQKQRFLLKLCIKVLQDESDIKEILKSLLGEKKFKGNKVMNNPSYIYEQDEITGERPANLACKYGNAKFLQILLDDFKVCPARKNRYGDTALHSTIEGIYLGFCTNEKALECIKFIVRNKRVLDILNASDDTALCRAMKLSMYDIAKELVNEGAFVRDHWRQDITSIFGTNDYINCPHLKLLEDIEEFIKDKNEHLLELKLRDFEIKSLTDGKEGYDKNLKMKINHLISLAMKNKMLVAVKSLLKCGADINLPLTDEGSTLLHEAVDLQLFDCVAALFEHQSTNDSTNVNSKQQQTHAEVLHLALKSGQKSVIEELLKHDVDLFHRNEQGSKLISLMTASQLRSYFDHRVQRGAENKEDILAIDFNCLFLKENENVDTTNKTTEMDVLKTIASLKKHRTVLNHPLIRCFLYFKMDRVYWLYYLNFIFYFLFILSFTSFVLPGNNNLVPTEVHFTFTAIFTVILLFREVIQFSFAPSIYFKQLENWLEILIIMSTSAVLSIYFFGVIGTWWKRITSFGILLSYIELMLMIGRHPRLATYITMFFRVSLSVLYFTIWYGPLLLAFSFIFFIFLHDGNESFQSIWNTMFKSVVMLAGEFEADTTWSMKNETSSEENSTSSDILSGRVFFIFFIFFIVIVLVNLLNALAVSDTNAVKEDAEILTYVSQINFLYRIEISLSGNWVKKFRLSKKLLNQFRLLTEEQDAAKPGVTQASNDIAMVPLNGHRTVDIDADQNCAIIDLKIRKRLKFNRVTRIALVQLLEDTKKLNQCGQFWNHFKFLPSFLEILDDSLDMLLQTSKDSIKDKNEFKDLHTKLEKIDRDMFQLKHIENKVDSLDIKIKNAEQTLYDSNISNINIIKNQFSALNERINSTERKLIDVNVKLNSILELLSKK